MSNTNNKAKEQPLSPHLTIYKPQITSVLSISHRASGVFLYIGAFILAWAMILAIYNHSYVIDLFLTPLGQFMLFGWSFLLFYHMLNGIRHLFWDIGKGFELKTVSLTGYIVVIGAVNLTAASWIFAKGGF